ncbi:MAG: acetate--CoA ligase [Alphaproteobacteria bacterium]|nr:acetate--CoA ligase [Alphaproteobacteria bacterium]
MGPRGPRSETEAPLSDNATRYATIRKNSASFAVPPNLVDYHTACSAFSWDRARKDLSGLPSGGLNIAYEAVDRHARGPRARRVALRCIGKAGERRDYTYGELAAFTNRFANVLQSMGVKAGDSVFVLLGRVPELYVAMLGALKAKCVVSPLFSAFGPEPIATRMEIGEARVLITTEALYRRKVEALRGRLPKLDCVILVDADEYGERTRSWRKLTRAASDAFETPATHPQEAALLHFTSGTTGRPKGVIHVHEAVVTHYATGLYALDLHDNDRFWCTADPGWVTGTSYGVIAPLTHGVTNIVVEAEFDAPTWYGLLAQEKISVWYTAPTAIRIMMKLGASAVKNYDLSALRFAASVGEPLNAEAVVWGMEAFGLPFHDNWWQTEAGGIMIANFASMDVKPGSMGRPLPGIEASIVRRKADGGVETVAAGEEGELALKTGWPSMMRGYLHEEARKKCFADGWYLTGDLARCDEDGYFWFVGRADDVIKSSGHLIGPFEVESALMEHPAVAEAAVIGKPDPIAGEIVKAFVALKLGFEADEAIRKELLGHARKRLGAAVAPKEIEFRANLPKTRSGKIMRRLLKARELGLPEGDLSTLESDER